MIALYILVFCRIFIGLVFGYSFLRKAMNIPAFEQTILEFHILPNNFSRITALLFLSGECAVTLLLMVGGPFLILGFILSIFLLLLFCSALVSLLHRNIRSSCNCFGPTQKPVSAIEVWRNIGFILCAIIGCGVLAASNNGQGHLGLIEWGLIGLGAAVCVVIWIQLGEIVYIFRQD
jgi:uncharacterized membrane protein YphA (DoxX/SURF4 family)